MRSRHYQVLVLQSDRHAIQVSRGIEESRRRAPNQFWEARENFQEEVPSQLTMHDG